MMEIKPEIVAPAGNLEKLKFAVRYGADAVYFGGSQFNLRVKADNFTAEDIEEGVSFCRQHNVKTIFLLNSFLHESNIQQVQKYIAEISQFNFDALMVSDPGMIVLLQDLKVRQALHLSTQMSTLNHLAINFWQKQGIERIVLGRETTLDEIHKIREKTSASIEIFAHGALCISYSGRCLLSRYLTGRDANNGDCSHPCRWNYSLVEKKRPGNYLDIIEHAHGTEILSSKDLCLVDKLDAYIEAGVDAFKIEGRMKSLYHAANTTRIYKHAASLAGTPEFKKNIHFWQEELDLINHRPYTSDLFNEFDQEFEDIPYIKKALFLGYNNSNTGEDKTIQVKTFNPVYLNEKIDVIYPIDGIVKDTIVEVREINHPDAGTVDMARPNAVYTITFDKAIDNHAIFRRRLQNI